MKTVEECLAFREELTMAITVLNRANDRGIIKLDYVLDKLGEYVFRTDMRIKYGETIQPDQQAPRDL